MKMRISGTWIPASAGMTKGGFRVFVQLPVETLTRNRLSAFEPFQLLHIIQSFGELNDRSVLGVHLKEIDQVRSPRTVEDTLLDQENWITKGIPVQDCAAHTTAGARAGYQQAVDVLAYQIRNQVRAEKSARARFADDELSLLGLDHLRKLSRQLFEVCSIDATLGGVAEGRFEVRVAGRVDHRNVRFATGAEQLLNFRQCIPRYFPATRGEFVD